MGLDEMLEHQPQVAGVASVAARLSGLDILQDHAADHRHAVVAMAEILAEFGSDNAWDMLMLGDRRDLLLGQIAEREAIFVAQHDASSHNR